MLCFLKRIFIGSLIKECPSIRVEFQRKSSLTAVRAFDVEPNSYNWDGDIAHRDAPCYSHIRLVSCSLNLKRSFQIEKHKVFH